MNSISIMSKMRRENIETKKYINTQEHQDFYVENPNEKNHGED
jgi:hypothetical protein